MRNQDKEKKKYLVSLSFRHSMCAFHMAFLEYLGQNVDAAIAVLAGVQQRARTPSIRSASFMPRLSIVRMTGKAFAPPDRCGAG